MTEKLLDEIKLMSKRCLHQIFYLLVVVVLHDAMLP